MTLLPPSPVSTNTGSSLQPPAVAPSPGFSTTSASPAPTSGGFDIWGPLQRRKYLIAMFSILGAIVGYFYYANCPKVYSSNARLMITTQAPPSVTGPDYRIRKESLDKHASLLGSELVLRNAAEKGNFENMRTFEDSTYAVGSLKEMLRVVPISQETLSIVCTGSDPDELPAILDKIIASYRNEIEEDSKNDGKVAREYIEKVNEQLLQDKQEAETERGNLWAQLGIESTDNQGNIINPHNKKLFRLQDKHDSLRHQLRDVQERARLLAKNLQAEPASGLIDETQVKISAIEAQEYLKLTRAVFKEEALGGDQVVRNLAPDLQRRQALQNKIWEEETRITELQFERSKLSDVFGAGHKQMAAIDNQLQFFSENKAVLDAELAELEAHIRKEAAFLQASLNKDVDDDRPRDLESFRAGENRQWIRMYQLKLQQEQSRLVKTIATLEAEIDVVSQKAQAVANGITRLNLLQTQIDKKGEAVSAIVNKLSEINILANDKYTSTEVKILDRPKRGGKVAPSLPKSLALGTMLASLLGLGLAVLVDQSELAFRNPTEIFHRLQVPVVGRIPRINVRQIEPSQGHASLVAAHKPAATASESFRDVRTGLFFRSNVDDIKTILFTSPSPGDGKSTTICNIAISIAQAGKRVCLVDADFRRPRIHQYFGQDLSPGLMDVLSGDLELDEATQSCALQNDLFLLAAGGRPDNPGELVTSQEFRNLIETLRDKFDYVLIDSPPVLPVSDPATIASIVDGVYLVTRIRKGVKLTAQKAKETLDRVGANWMGVIVNGLDENPHYSEYGYQHGAYSYYGGVYGRYYDSNSKVYRDKITAK